MFKFRRVMLVAAMLAGGFAGHASAGIFQCSIQQDSGNLGWIAPTIVVSHKDGEATAIVSDQILESVYGKPVAAKVATENKLRTTYTWKLQSNDNSGTSGITVYRLTIIKADLSARVSAVPLGFSNNFNAGGKCKKTSG